MAVTRAASRPARGPRDPRPTVFMDKDGTLIEDVPYNVDPRRVRLANGAAEAIRLLSGAGYRLVVVTNQSGIARGYFTEHELGEIEAHLAAELRALGATLDGFYFCPHEPTGVNEYGIVCSCRKPEPGLVLRAARELRVDLSRAWFVGDTWMDVVAGRRAGCRTIMIGPEHRDARELPDSKRPDHAVPDLLDAARIILAEDARSAAPVPGAVA